MLRLSVLGQIDLRTDAGGEVRPVLAQPKRLALLVYLIASTPVRFHRRDALLALFWPERSEDDARNALRQAIHQLRQSLGSDVIASRGADSVGVDATKIACDAVDFETALDRGMLADALAAYRGDLLPGFSIAGAEGFNEWLDDTRARLRHRAARAAWALAEQQERTGMLDAQDYVLTPQDMAAIDAQLATMNAYISDVAESNGFAFFDLDPLYGRKHLKQPFSAETLLMSAEPYGPFISLDGVHPSAEGHRILAREAARALNVTYHLGISRGLAAERAPGRRPTVALTAA